MQIIKQMREIVGVGRFIDQRTHAKVKTNN